MEITVVMYCDEQITLWAEGRGTPAALPTGGAQRAARMRRLNKWR